MRLELFYKSAAELSLILQTTTRLQSEFRALENIQSFNLANKARNERGDLLKAAHVIKKKFRCENGVNICVHYSMKNNKCKTFDETMNMFADFLQKASDQSTGINEVLLCSGGGKVKPTPDALSVLRALPASAVPPNIKLSVAYNPYEANIEVENERLAEKLQYVDKVYLQFGTNVRKLIEGLEFIKKLDEGRAHNGKPVVVVGSCMLPSKQLLARFRFRPWAGMVLSDEFLSDVDVANKIVRDLVNVYREYHVEAVIETAVNDKNVMYLDELFSLDDYDLDKKPIVSAEMNVRSKRKETETSSKTGEILQHKLAKF